MSANQSTCALFESLTPAQRQLAEKMEQCEQMPDYSTLQHGLDCFANFDTMLDILWYEKFNTTQFKLPEWFTTYGKSIYANIHNMETAERYIVFHDGGKWACLITDADGKRHFPNHAEVSQKIFREHFDDETAAKMIGWDMALHTMKDADIDYWLAQWSTKDACTLLLASLAEIHANAALFGGLESQSFKIKWKQISKRGMAICKKLFGEQA